MKFDLKNILLGLVIGTIGTTSVFLLIGDVDIQTDFQFGEKLDQDDKDIKISIEKNLVNYFKINYCLKTLFLKVPIRFPHLIQL